MEPSIATLGSGAPTLSLGAWLDPGLVALRYGANLRAREIAEQLGMNTGAVEVALRRALERLNLELDTAPVARSRGMGELAP